MSYILDINISVCYVVIKYGTIIFVLELGKCIMMLCLDVNFVPKLFLSLRFITFKKFQVYIFNPVN